MKFKNTKVAYIFFLCSKFLIKKEQTPKFSADFRHKKSYFHIQQYIKITLIEIMALLSS